MTLPSLKLYTEVVLISLLFTAEWFFPFYIERRNRVRHGFRNLLIASINGVMGTFLFSSCLLLELAWIDNERFGLLNYIFKNGEFSTSRTALALILFDLWMYWWHRANHLNPTLWRFHRMHHSDPEMDVTTGIRFHPGEIALSFLARLLVIPVLGVSLKEILIYEILLQFIILFHHSNIALSTKLDYWLSLFIVTPNLHRVHHSEVQAETDSNFASVLSLWDRVFGSATRVKNPQNISLGLADFKDPKWQEVSGLLKTPFK